MTFAEQLSPTGKWRPVTFNRAVATHQKSGRMILADGLGPRLRAIKEVHKNYRHLNIDQLAALYGTFGRFRAVGAQA